MALLKPHDMEHGVVIPCGTENRIPASLAYAKAAGVRGMHYGWPGMTQTQNGDLLVSASERIQHVDPYGRGVVVRSSDNGRTWSAPQVVFESVTDDRDIALNTLPDGTVVATWFSSSAWAAKRWTGEFQPMLERTTPDTLAALARGWLRRSPDGGRTWEDAVFPTVVGQHAGPTPLSNGDIIYLGPYRHADPSVMAATLSTDGGRTWSIVGEVPGPTVTDQTTGKTGTGLNENHVVEVAPGRLVAAFRTATEQRNVHIARSEDGGRTWTKAEALGVYGFPPYLVKLRSGTLLCVFADRREPRTVRCIFSYDDGATWDTDNVHTLRQLDFMADMGYPVAREVSPDEVVCIYYAIPKPGQPGYGDLDMNQWGILSTRFRVD